MFDVVILNPRRILFKDRVSSAFLPGDNGEFEILPYHCPIISLLKEGNIIFDAKKRLHIRGGIVKFHRNELVALVEE